MVASSPLTRSSHHAGDDFARLRAGAGGQVRAGLGARMPKFNVTREMPYKAAELFAIAADVDSYKDFLPLVESSRTFDRERDGRGCRALQGRIAGALQEAPYRRDFRERCRRRTEAIQSLVAGTRRLVRSYRLPSGSSLTASRVAPRSSSRSTTRQGAGHCSSSCPACSITWCGRSTTPSRPGPASSIERLRDFSVTALKELAQERRRRIRDADDFVRRLAIELEIELGLGPVVLPVTEPLELAASERPLGNSSTFDGDADARRLSGDGRFPGIGVTDVTTPCAINPCPPSFSLANRKIMSPSAMRLPPYIVFWPSNAKLVARGIRISALMANAMICSRQLRHGAQLRFDKIERCGH